MANVRGDMLGDDEEVDEADAEDWAEADASDMLTSSSRIISTLLRRSSSYFCSNDF